MIVLINQVIQIIDQVGIKPFTGKFPSNPHKVIVPTTIFRNGEVIIIIAVVNLILTLMLSSGFLLGGLNGLKVFRLYKVFQLVEGTTRFRVSEIRISNKVGPSYRVILTVRSTRYPENPCPILYLIVGLTVFTILSVCTKLTSHSLHKSGASFIFGRGDLKSKYSL